jgi:hypothetical protein
MSNKKYGTREYVEETLEEYSKMMAVKSFDIETGIAEIDFKKLADEYFGYRKEEIEKELEESNVLELAGGEFYGLDNDVHFLYEMVFFMLLKQLYDKYEPKP